MLPGRGSCRFSCRVDDDGDGDDWRREEPLCRHYIVRPCFDGQTARQPGAVDGLPRSPAVSVMTDSINWYLMGRGSDRQPGEERLVLVLPLNLLSN